MKTLPGKNQTKDFKDKSLTSGLFSFLIVSVFQIILSVNTLGQNPTDSSATTHIFFTQPLGILYKDYSIGYELKRKTDLSYTLIIDVYAQYGDDKITYVQDEALTIYKGISVRPGIKHIKANGRYKSVEGYYKLSGYSDKLILRDDNDGDAYDVYYLESRICNSFGIAFKYGYELHTNHFYLSPFVSVGGRIRFDYLIIDGKYNYQEYPLSTEKEQKFRVWPIPIFRVGFLMGFEI